MKKLTVFLIIVGVLSFTMAAEEPMKDTGTKAKTIEQNKFSFGINNVPWAVSMVSFRWWKSEKKGSEFTIGYFNNNHADYYFSDDTSFNIGLLRYDWLRRKKSAHLKGLYYTRGFGMSLGGNAEFRSEPYISDKIFGVWTLYLPIGFEHFFLPNYRRLSYSFQADIYSSLSGFYNKYNLHGKTTETTDWRVRLGVKLQFFLRLYLK